jgi:hypothetical protein
LVSNGLFGANDFIEEDNKGGAKGKLGSIFDYDDDDDETKTKKEFERAMKDEENKKKALFQIEEDDEGDAYNFNPG